MHRVFGLLSALIILTFTGSLYANESAANRKNKILQIGVHTGTMGPGLDFGIYLSETGRLNIDRSQQSLSLLGSSIDAETYRVGW